VSRRNWICFLGPEHWHKWFPCAAGNEQSPIALEREKCTAQASPLELSGYTGLNNLSAVNLGAIGEGMHRFITCRPCDTNQLRGLVG